MKNHLLHLAVISAIISSCNNSAPSAPVAVADNKPADTVRPTAVAPPARPVPDVRTEAAALQRRLQRFEVPSQHLTASAQAPSIVKGAGGTRILVAPKDMVTLDGQPVTDDIDVELKELPGIEQMMRQGTQTTSDGKLLTSGGAYYVNMKSGGRQLRLKMGRTLKVMLPKNTDAPMNLFYGQKDSNGVMNWTGTTQQFKNFDVDSSAFLFANSGRAGGGSGGTGQSTDKIPDAIKKDRELALLFDALPSAKKDTNRTVKRDTSARRTPGEKKNYKALAQGVYNEVAVQDFGWINCDRFRESQDLTTLACEFAPGDSITYAKVFLAFKDINSIMEERYVYNRGATFRNIPNGTPATVIAMAMRKGTLYTSRTDVQIGQRRTVQLAMKKTRDSEVAELLKM